MLMLYITLIDFCIFGGGIIGKLCVCLTILESWGKYIQLKVRDRKTELKRKIQLYAVYKKYILI